MRLLSGWNRPFPLSAYVLLRRSEPSSNILSGDAYVSRNDQPRTS